MIGQQAVKLGRAMRRALKAPPMTQWHTRSSGMNLQELPMANDNSPNPSHSEEPPPPSSDDRTRLYLALMVGALFIVLALITVVQPTAGAVLDKVLPLLTMVLGYFFGREVQRARS
jgi:hypothetical protein